MTVIEPYLVQRGEINRPLNKFKDLRLSRAVDLDYMGAAEFEFGALPKSLRRIEANIDKLTRRVMTDLVHPLNQAALRVVSYLSDEDYAKYQDYTKEIWEERRQLKEDAHFNLVRLKYGKERLFNTDFWWDIQNDVMWSFDKSFMNNLHEHLAASFNYMNSENKT